MKTFNIKRYLSTLGAALTLSATSFGAQAATFTYETDGSVLTNPGSAFVGMDIGGSLFVTFDGDDGGDGTLDLGDFDEALGYDGNAARSSVKFIFRNINTSITFPALNAGTVTASTLTVDGAGDITGGSVSLRAATPTGTFGDLNLNYDSGSWDFYLGDGALLVSTGEISAVPVPAAAWLFGSALVGLVGVGRRRKLAA
jgi:hypothetical protein